MIQGSTLEETERAAGEVLSLPMHPFLSSEAVGAVARAVRECDVRPPVST